MRKIMAFAFLVAFGFANSLGYAQSNALDKNCAVCLYKMGKLVPGDPAYTATFDRQTYYFPGEKQQKIFQANPAKFAPALAGDCIVCLVEMGARMPGNTKFWTKHNGRMYLFPEQKQIDMFKGNPEKYADADLAFDGYCPVCLLDMEKLVPGKKEFTSIYDGLRYRFPGPGPKQKFDANPAKYAPAFGGNCVVCKREMGKNVRGSLKYGAFYKGRSFLFPSEKARSKFMANPSRYARTDIANDGNCVVCQKKMGKDMPGSMEHASMYKGLLYLFPGPKQKAMFNANPELYIGIIADSAAKSSSGSATSNVGLQPNEKTKTVKVVGKTACAGCEYGKRPITDPNSLGLAVVAGKKVYIVEGAEKQYPKVYSNRFQELPVEVTGTVRRQQGNFVWLNPTALRKIQ